MTQAEDSDLGAGRRTKTLALLGAAIQKRVSPERRAFVRYWYQDVRTAQLRSVLNGQAALSVRVVTVGGSLVLPVLAGLNLQGGVAYSWVPAAVLTISLVVAMATALQQTIRYGTRFQMYQRFSFSMESEGWAFVNRTGDYEGKSDDEAYSIFVEKVQLLRDLRQNDLLTKTIEEEALTSAAAKSDAVVGP